MRLGIFRSAPLVRANLGAMCLFGAYVGFQFVATLYLQTTLGWSALETALAFLPGGLLVAFGAPRMGARDQPLRHGQAGRGLERSPFAIGYALFLRVDATPYVLTFLPDDAADRRRLRARLLGAERPGDGRASPTTSRAWPPASSRPRSRWAARSCWPR